MNTKRQHQHGKSPLWLGCYLEFSMEVEPPASRAPGNTSYTKHQKYDQYSKLLIKLGLSCVICYTGKITVITSPEIHRILMKPLKK